MQSASPVLLLVIAIAAGAAMDATIKHLAANNHFLLVTFARYLIGAMFSLGIWFHAGRPVITGEMWRAHAMRGVVITISAVSFFWALTVLPLVEAVTLSFLYPLLAPFASRVMLGERVRPTSMITALVGFAGVIIAAQGGPSPEQSPMHAWGVAAVIVAATSFAIAITLLRARSQTDGPAIVGLMTSVVPAIILVGPAIVFAPPPNLGDWPFFLQLGALAAAFMYLMSAAYARAQAQQLAPIHYTELVWATLFGFLIFHETPRVQVLFGAILIVSACLYVAFEERRLGRRGAADKRADAELAKEAAESRP